MDCGETLTKNLNIKPPYVVKLWNLNQCLWGLTYTMRTAFCLSPSANHAITRRHANNASFLPWKPSLTWPFSCDRGVQPWIPRSSYSVISTQNRPLTMDFGLSSVFLVLILKVICRDEILSDLCTWEIQKLFCFFILFCFLATVSIQQSLIAVAPWEVQLMESGEA